MKINTELCNNIIGVYGSDGKLWLERLSKMISEIKTTLGIIIHAPFENLSFNYVAPCILQNGTIAIFIGRK